MSSYTEGQTHQVMDALQAAGWTADDVTKFGQFKDLPGIRSVVRGHAEIRVVKRPIQRAPFDPAPFIGAGWTTWRGPINGNGLEGEEECDKRSLALQEVDFTQARFVDGLKEGEKTVKGEEKLRRMRESGDILLDPGFAVTLLNEPGQATLEWYYKTTGKTYLDFMGRILRNPNGNRYVLCVFRSGGGQWGWRFFFWLGDGWFADDLSASLATLFISLRLLLGSFACPS